MEEFFIYFELSQRSSGLIFRQALAKSNNRKDELMEENEKRRNVELAYLSLMLSGKKVSECELASEVLKISRAKGEKSPCDARAVFY